MFIVGAMVVRESELLREITDDVRAFARCGSRRKHPRPGLTHRNWTQIMLLPPVFAAAG